MSCRNRSRRYLVLACERTHQRPSFSVRFRVTRNWLVVMWAQPDSQSPIRPFRRLLRAQVGNYSFTNCSSTWSKSRSLTISRLLVTHLDHDMEFVWTPKHLDKMSWHRNSSVQIKPLQPTNSFFSANPATIRIDSLDFRSGRRSKKGSFRIAVIREAFVMGDFTSPKRFPNIGSAPS